MFRPEVVLSPLLAHILPTLLFAALGLPLVWQDLKESTVSSVLLAAVFLAWSAMTLFLGDGISHLLAALIVLALGSLLLMIFPGRLGEADVVFMSGMALFLPFWSLLIAMALGCIAALAAFVWLSRGAGADSFARPLPFLPSLYWGGLTIIIGGIRI